MHFTDSAPSSDLVAAIGQIDAFTPAQLSSFSELILVFLTKTSAADAANDPDAKVAQFASESGVEPDTAASATHTVLAIFAQAVQKALTPQQMKEVRDAVFMLFGIFHSGLLLWVDCQDLSSLGLSEASASALSGSYRALCETTTFVPRTKGVQELVDMEWKFGGQF